MNFSNRCIIMSYLLFISSLINGMENSSKTTVPLLYLKEFKSILETHTPLGKAIPYIKQLENNDETWKSILNNKTSCDVLLKFTTALELSTSPKETIAVFIGTPGMIDWTRDYIKKNPTTETHLNKMLIDTGLWINPTWENQATDVARAIIQVTKNANPCNEAGQTALINAAKNGNADLVELLIQHKAKVNQRHPNSHTTPLIEAAHNGHFQVVQKLLEAGANPTAQNEYGETALLIVKEILDAANTYKLISVALTVAEKIHTLQEK